MRRFAFFLSLLALLAPACRKPAPSAHVVMIPSHDERVASKPSTAAGAVTVAGVAFDAPAAWRSQPPSSPMRAAQYAIPGSGADKDATFVVYYFGRGQGGTAEDNVRRWEGQFTAPDGTPAKGKVDRRTINGLAVTVVTAEGTFASGMPMGPSTPEPGSALWGAIVEGPQGNIFLKATGPRATVEGAHADFEKALASLRSAGTSM